MEPGVVLMGRGLEYGNLSNLKIDAKERHPGDGMEAHLFEHHLKLLPTSSYKASNMTLRNLIVQAPQSNIKNSEKKKNKKNALSYSYDDIANARRPSDPFTKSHQDLTVLVDMLKTKLKLYEDHNNQLIEEKMRLSNQLGVQTQVNNELKKLLIASIGDDLQQKYERMIQDKYLADMELEHLHNTLEEDREEVEHAMIQADVWRSKFLASRVMSDELSRWKSILYYKYRETHTALQSLLEEHSKIRALNNATKRGLVKVVDLLESKDPSLDIDRTLTTIDVAFMNNDLAESICELMSESKPKLSPLSTPPDDEDRNAEHENILKPDFTDHIGNDQLTLAEQLAQKVVLNPGIQSEELTRMRHDYLVHNRISHFLSTNYHVVFNCCNNCTGTLQVI